MIPDCTTCGACCTAEAYGGGPFVTVYGADSERFGPSELEPEPMGCDFLRSVPAGPGEVRCVFLKGALGGACACTAYDRRPQVCRDFEAGSDECHRVRAQRFGTPG